MKNIPKISFVKKKTSQYGFEVFSIKNLFARAHQAMYPIDQPHRLKFYQVIFVTEGKGKHTIDFKTFDFKEGSLIFTSKGQVQSFNIEDNLDGYIIIFTEEFLTKNLVDTEIMSIYRLYNYHLQTPLIQPNKVGIKMFKNLAEEISKEHKLADDFAKEEILRLLLKLFLLKAERIKRTLVPSENNSEWLFKFREFQDLLEKDINNCRIAAEYAGKLDISYKHLNEICKSVTGSTAKEIIDNFLILEIKRQLALTNNSIKELTFVMGFDEPTNFVKFFKKHTALTPAQFKKSLSNIF